MQFMHHAICVYAYTCVTTHDACVTPADSTTVKGYCNQPQVVLQAWESKACVEKEFKQVS